MASTGYHHHFFLKQHFEFFYFLFTFRVINNSTNFYGLAIHYKIFIAIQRHGCETIVHAASTTFRVRCIF